MSLAMMMREAVLFFLLPSFLSTMSSSGLVLKRRLVGCANALLLTYIGRGFDLISDALHPTK